MRNTPEEPVIQYTFIDSTIGRVLIAESARGVCAVLPGENDDTLTEDLRARFPAVSMELVDSGVMTAAEDVRMQIDDPSSARACALDLRGTPFQKQVWEALLAVPSGATASYTDLAERIGRPQSVRAVAQACGANALAVLVPCHRAVRRDGGLSGYRWGVERKRALLEREGARPSPTN